MVRAIYSLWMLLIEILCIEINMTYVVRADHFLLDVINGDLYHYISITPKVLCKVIVITNVSACLRISELPLGKAPSSM